MARFLDDLSCFLSLRREMFLFLMPLLIGVGVKKCHFSRKCYRAGLLIFKSRCSTRLNGCLAGEQAP